MHTNIWQHLKQKLIPFVYLPFMNHHLGESKFKYFSILNTDPIDYKKPKGHAFMLSPHHHKPSYSPFWLLFLVALCFLAPTTYSKWPLTVWFSWLFSLLCHFPSLEMFKQVENFWHHHFLIWATFMASSFLLFLQWLSGQSTGCLLSSSPHQLPQLLLPSLEGQFGNLMCGILLIYMYE